MNTRAMPLRGEMVAAFLSRVGSYDGVFFTGVGTTGVFCRPTCPAKKPLEKNVEFFSSAQAALLAGFRPCRRCRPMEPTGSRPSWLRELSPERVRRWFQSHHGMTFHAYGRARRLGLALGQIKHGSGVNRAAFRTGYNSLSGFNDAFRRFMGNAPTALTGAKVVTVTRITTPLGPMVAGSVDDALCLLEFADRRMIEMQIARLQKRLDCVFAPGTSVLFAELGTSSRATSGVN